MKCSYEGCDCGKWFLYLRLVIKHYYSVLPLPNLKDYLRGILPQYYYCEVVCHESCNLRSSPCKRWFTNLKTWISNTYITIRYGE